MSAAERARFAGADLVIAFSSLLALLAAALAGLPAVTAPPLVTAPGPADLAACLPVAAVDRFPVALLAVELAAVDLVVPDLVAVDFVVADSVAVDRSVPVVAAARPAAVFLLVTCPAAPSPRPLRDPLLRLGGAGSPAGTRFLVTARPVVVAPSVRLCFDAVPLPDLVVAAPSEPRTAADARVRLPVPFPPPADLAGVDEVCFAAVLGPALAVALPAALVVAFRAALARSAIPTPYIYETGRAARLPRTPEWSRIRTR